MAINLKRPRELIALLLTLLVVAIVILADGGRVIQDLYDSISHLILTYDEQVFVKFGSLILSGQDPYIVPDFAYPPTAFPFLILRAIGPVFIMAVLAIAINFTVSYLIIRNDEARVGKRRVWWLWFLFFPLTFTIQDGQVPLMFLAVATLAYQRRTGWLSALFAAAIMMTKPQDGIILLVPIALIWWREAKHTILQFVIVCAIWGGIPLLFSPGLYAEWLARMQELSGYYGPLNSPSFWSLGTIFPALNLFAAGAALITGIVIVLLAFKRLNLPESLWINLLRILLVGVLPFGMFYQNVYLVLTAPVGVMVPASLIALILPGFLNIRNQLMVIIPLAALASWLVVNRRYFRQQQRSVGVSRF